MTFNIDHRAISIYQIPSAPQDVNLCALHVYLDHTYGLVQLHIIEGDDLDRWTLYSRSAINYPLSSQIRRVICDQCTLTRPGSDCYSVSSHSVCDTVSVGRRIDCIGQVGIWFKGFDLATRRTGQENRVVSHVCANVEDEITDFDVRSNGRKHLLLVGDLIPFNPALDIVVFRVRHAQ
jgi:hypothetical protein